MWYDERLSRRDALRHGLTATTASVLGGGLKLPLRSAASPRAVTTPSEALDELMAGNKRFVDLQLTAHDHDLSILKQHTEQQQEPFAAVLSCADSRVPVELIFDQTIGHIFVTRVAGNITTPEIIASLEYGAAVLGTKAILVLGHANCGAVKAAINGKDVPGQISALFPHLGPAVVQAGGDVERTTKANAKLQAALLRRSSVVIADMCKAEKVRVVAAYYDLGTGVVTQLE